jgi:cation diffusion facilitator CzcD-associated flavoprotein CzcO
LEHGLNQIVTSILFNREGQKEIRQQFAQLMRERLQFDEALCAELIPTWDVGCRRFSPAGGYLESLLEPNVVAELRPIERVTPAGIRTTDGQEEPFDLIICATGFDVSFKPPWKMVGRNDADLARLWDEEDPKAYLSMMVPGFPNYFICNGPNCPIGHGGVLAAIESTVEYICKWAQKVAKEDIKYFSINFHRLRKGLIVMA